VVQSAAANCSKRAETFRRRDEVEFSWEIRTILTPLHPFFTVILSFSPCSRKTRKTIRQPLHKYISNFGIRDKRQGSQPEDTCDKKHVVRPRELVVIFAYFRHLVAVGSWWEMFVL
jgi:hypothetical protein